MLHHLISSTASHWPCPGGDITSEAGVASCGWCHVQLGLCEAGRSAEDLRDAGVTASGPLAAPCVCPRVDIRYSGVQQSDPRLVLQLCCWLLMDVLSTNCWLSTQPLDP